MEPFIGQIMIVGFNFPPRGWASCDGQLLPIASNTALFSLLGTTFGGDGRTTFALPDLRGRTFRHVGTGPGLQPVSWGQRAGSNTRILTVANLPAHNHSVSLPVSTAAGEEASPANNFLANHAGAFAEDPTAGQNSGAGTSGNTGSNTAVDINNPFLGLHVNIALQGLFPSRN